MGLGGAINTKAVLLHDQKVKIAILSVVAGTISVLTCLAALYWFILMRRNFRRTLIMLLLVADCFRSLWFVVFPAVALAHGQVQNGDPFCDAGGFFIQMGLEACDVAIFLMSLHMSLQIFNAGSGSTGSDGLYRYRYAVYVVWLVLPAFDASLAFVNTKSPAYLLQGAFCSLPIRPFWYRLALMWIPRYLIWAYVVFIAIRIYMHVGSGFQVFARKVSSSSQARTGQGNSMGQDTANDRSSKFLVGKVRSHNLLSSFSDNAPDLPPFMSETQPPLDPQARRPSVVRFDSGGHFLKDKDGLRDHSYEKDKDTASGPSEPSSSRRGSAKDAVYESFEGSPPLQPLPKPNAVYNPEASGDFPALPTIEEGNGAPLTEVSSTVEVAAAKRKRAIQRQVRLLFIYPCVYMILMVIPFVSHAMTYSDYYAQHPVYIVSALSTFCYAIMGAADCVVFSWREKPWTLIPGADGTFWGSFCFWRFLFKSSQSLHQSVVLSNLAQDGRQGGTANSNTNHRRAPLIHRRVFSGQSDRAALAAERAAERLAMERQAVAERRASALAPVAESGAENKRSTKPREWFDHESLMSDDNDNVSESSVHLAPEQQQERRPSKILDFANKDPYGAP
ncbi:hypothetical protein MBLNU457_1277t1 [Dothideomycetes sp. NU457]